MATSAPPEDARQVHRVVAQTGPIYRLSVDQYHAMIHAGILTEDDRVELLEGYLVPKMTKKQPHNIASGSVGDVLFRIVPPGWYVAREEPVTAADDSEPEPDVMIVRGSRRDYPDDPPRGSDVALVIEVADASLARDKIEKKRIYARSGIPVYWLVNLPGRRIEVYTDPTGPSDWPDYRARRDFGAEDAVPVAVAGHELARLAVRDLLPREGA